MPVCIAMSKEQVNHCKNKELEELLTEANKHFSSTLCVHEYKDIKTRLLRSPMVSISYQLLVDSGSWDLQLLTAAGTSKATIKAWLYGYLVAIDGFNSCNKPPSV